MYYITAYMERPVLKLDVRECNPDLGSLYNMLPLQDGTVLVHHRKDDKDHASRLSDKGNVIRNLITTDKLITGFILMSNKECLILNTDGSLQRVRIEDGQFLGSGYEVPDVEWLCDGIRIDDDQVLLADRDKGQIFIYDIKTRNKHVVLDKLNRPTSVDKAVTDQGVFYIVNECGARTVRVYNESWRLVTSIGGEGGEVGRLILPRSARVLPDNSIIVADWGNHRISRFTIQGDFVNHIIKLSDGIRYPYRLAVKYPYVWVAPVKYPYAWVAYSHYSIKCYQIYQ